MVPFHTSARLFKSMAEVMDNANTMQGICSSGKAALQARLHYCLIAILCGVRHCTWAVCMSLTTYLVRREKLLELNLLNLPKTLEKLVKKFVNTYSGNYITDSCEN